MTRYHLGDLLSYTTGKLTAPDKMTGVRRLAEGVTGEAMTEVGLLETITPLVVRVLLAQRRLALLAARTITTQSSAVDVARACSTSCWGDTVVDISCLPRRSC